jgi:hypothetical protein
MRQDRWYDVTLLSIRTCGCRARVVVYTESDHYFEPHFALVLRMTSVEILRCPDPGGGRPIDWIRHQWLRDYLGNHSAEFDRVAMLDLYDNYVNRDPFEVFDKPETITFIEEGWKIDEAGVNGWWVDVCFGEAGRRIKFNETLCTGTIFGGPAVLLKFINVLFERWPGIGCQWDQPVVNWIVWTGVLDELGIRWRTKDCNGWVLTLSKCPSHVALVGHVKEGFNGNNQIPHLVHQWKQFGDWKDMYVERCDMTEYVARLEKFEGRNLNWSAPERK